MLIFDQRGSHGPPSLQSAQSMRSSGHPWQQGGYVPTAAAGTTASRYTAVQTYHISTGYSMNIKFLLCDIIQLRK